MTDSTQKHYSTCTLCEAMCGIEVTTQEREILSIAGDKQNPFSEGHVCPKAMALKDLYEDPDRVKKPLEKTASGWQELEWDEALDKVAQGLFDVQQKCTICTFEMNRVFCGNFFCHTQQTKGMHLVFGIVIFSV